MADPVIVYDPPEGFEDTSVFVTNPVSQAATRSLFQRLFTQVQTFINTTLIAWINATFASKTDLSGIVLGAIPNDSITDAQMADAMKKGVVGGVEAYNTANSHRTDSVIHVTAGDRSEWNSKATSTQGSKADAALPSASYTAADVLSKISTVDGTGSGLDADMIDGVHASALATLELPALTAILSNMITGQYYGKAITRAMAASCAVYDLLYPTSSGLNKAKADATSTLPCVAMCLETGTGSRKVLLPGSYIRNTSWAWTVGAPIYVSAATAGGLTQTMPSAGNQIQPIGHAATADIIDFNPPYMFAERM